MFGDDKHCTRHVYILVMNDNFDFRSVNKLSLTLKLTFQLVFLVLAVIE